MLLSFAYRTMGAVINRFYYVPKPTRFFLLFVNGHLVKTTALNPAMEAV